MHTMYITAEVTLYIYTKKFSWCDSLNG